MKSVSECKAGITIVRKHHCLKVYRKWMFLLVMKLSFHGKPDKHVFTDQKNLLCWKNLTLDLQ
jgi:hypothetical protein